MKTGRTIKEIESTPSPTWRRICQHDCHGETPAKDRLCAKCMMSEFDCWEREP